MIVLIYIKVECPLNNHLQSGIVCMEHCQRQQDSVLFFFTHWGNKFYQSERVRQSVNFGLAVDEIQSVYEDERLSINKNPRIPSCP